MKKTLVIAAAVAMAACVVALAQSEVLSQNAVGYVKKTVPAAGKFAIVVHSLDSMDGGAIKFTNTSIAAELPIGSKVYFWNVNAWDPGSLGTDKSGNRVWSGSAPTKTLVDGEAFFLQTANTQLVDVVVTIAGEVPADGSIGRSITGSNYFTSAGNPYPVSAVFTNTSLASNMPIGSTVYFWKTNFWDPGSLGTDKSGNRVWSGSAPGKTLEPGEGFFIKNPSNALTWTVDKPYTWP